MYKRELCGCRECARAFLSSLLDASERGEGGFERNARKRTGRAGGRDGWMVARALLSVFSTRAIYKSASLSFLGLNKTPRWIDAILTATSLSLSLSVRPRDQLQQQQQQQQPKDTSEEDALVTDPSKKTKKAFKKFSYRGVDLEQLLELKTDKLVDLFCARQRRRFRRGLGRKPLALVKKLRKAKREVQGMDKPETIRTHLRNMIIVPEMIGAIVGVYNGKVFNTVEIKPEMVGTYLAEYAITYKPISHGRAGIGGDKFIPLK